MALEILKCPNCGARAPASFAGAVAACEFCGAVLSGLAMKPAAPAPTPAPAPVATPSPSPAPERLRRAEPVSPAARASAETFTEAELLDLARRRLGLHESLYFDGNIPRGKLKAASETEAHADGMLVSLSWQAAARRVSTTTRDSCGKLLGEVEVAEAKAAAPAGSKAGNHGKPAAAH